MWRKLEGIQREISYVDGSSIDEKEEGSAIR